MRSFHLHGDSPYPPPSYPHIFGPEKLLPSVVCRWHEAPFPPCTCPPPIPSLPPQTRPWKPFMERFPREPRVTAAHRPPVTEETRAYTAPSATDLRVPPVCRLWPYRHGPGLPSYSARQQHRGTVRLSGRGSRKWLPSGLGNDGAGPRPRERRRPRQCQDFCADGLQVAAKQERKHKRASLKTTTRRNTGPGRSCLAPVRLR